MDGSLYRVEVPDALKVKKVPNGRANGMDELTDVEEKKKVVLVDTIK